MKDVFVVTGGSGGIGLEAAKMFKEAAVLIADIDEAALVRGKEALEALGIEAETAKCDVTDRAQTDALAKKASEMGNIKGVVHTAGVSGTVSNPDIVMKVDLIGSELVLESFLPYMECGSSVVLVSSMMGYTIPANPAYDNLMLNCQDEGFLEAIKPFHQGSSDNAYNFAKRGVHLLCEKWAVKFGEKGVRVNSISPGIIDTPMSVKAAEEHPEQMMYMQSITPLKRNGKPEDIGNVVEFICSDRASFITGSDIRADGGLIKNLLAISAKK